MSGFRSKKMMSNDRFGITYSWNQTYHGWPTQSKTPEMAVIEAIDHLVDSGLTHPEADRILKNIVNNSKE